ncbi:MAG: hypothetical protein DI601_00255 [Azospirillum brasilense]|nr:MAG: hypothetical protein DI601_00255 [Azospirillum brasilense]
MSVDRFFSGVARRSAAQDAEQGQPRLATVASVDPDTYSVRVELEPEGILSPWLPVGAAALGNGVALVTPPSPGDQVVVVPQEGSSDHLIVVGRVASTKHPVPTSPVTGKTVQPGEVGIVVPGVFVHLIKDAVHVHASRVDIVGDVKIRGDVAVEGGITATEDVTAGSVSLRQHRHRDVRAGSDISGPPQGG